MCIFCSVCSLDHWVIKYAHWLYHSASMSSSAGVLHIFIQNCVLVHVLWSVANDKVMLSERTTCLYDHTVRTTAVYSPPSKAFLRMMQPHIANTKDGVEQCRINVVLLTFRQNLLFTGLPTKGNLAEMFSLHWQVQKLWNNNALGYEKSNI